MKFSALLLASLQLVGSAAPVLSFHAPAVGGSRAFVAAATVNKREVTILSTATAGAASENLPASSTEQHQERQQEQQSRRSFLLALAAGAGGAATAGFLLPPPQARAYSSVPNFGEKLEGYDESVSSWEDARAKSWREEPKLGVAGEQITVVDASELEEEMEKKLTEERSLLERIPPLSPRVLLLGGTGHVGRRVRSILEDRLGVYVVATSRDGRDGTVEFDVTKCFGKVEDEVHQIAKENRCSAVVSLIGGVAESKNRKRRGDSDKESGFSFFGNNKKHCDNNECLIVNGAAGQAVLGASRANTVRNFVTIGPSPSITEKVPDGLEDYVEAKTLSQDLVVNTFNPWSGGCDDGKGCKDGLSYTILNPGAIGDYSKNYGRDPRVPLDVIADAVVVGALGFYLDENDSEILSKAHEIRGKASRIGKAEQVLAGLGGEDDGATRII